MHIHHKKFRKPIKVQRGNENNLFSSQPQANNCSIFWCIFFLKDLPDGAGSLRHPSFLPFTTVRI